MQGCNMHHANITPVHVLLTYKHLRLPSDPGIFPSATIVLLGICYDPILSKHLRLAEGDEILIH